MRRSLLPVVVASMVAGALGFTAPLVGRGCEAVPPCKLLPAAPVCVRVPRHLILSLCVSRSLPAARNAAATAQFRAGRLAAAPALRLSGGASALQASVLSGVKAKDIDGTFPPSRPSTLCWLSCGVLAF